MRGQVSALYLFTVNIIGLGLGPTVIAFATDFIFKDEALLKYSLSSVGGLTGVWAALMLWFGLSAFRASAKEAEDQIQVTASG